MHYRVETATALPWRVAAATMISSILVLPVVWPLSLWITVFLTPRPEIGAAAAEVSFAPALLDRPL